MNLPMSRLQSPRYRQVSLPMEVVDRIMFADVDSTKTLTRFYLINKGGLYPYASRSKYQKKAPWTCLNPLCLINFLW